MVTEAQNAARASLAEVAVTPLPTSSVVPQFPNMVSPMPYNTRAPANSQNSVGMRPDDRACRASGSTMGCNRVSTMSTIKPAAASNGRYHQAPRSGEDGDEQRRQRRSESEQDVERGEGHVAPIGHEGACIGTDRAQGETEPQAERGGGHQQHRKGDGVGANGIARHQQAHGHGVGDEPGEQYPLEPKPTCQPRTWPAIPVMAMITWGRKRMP